MDKDMAHHVALVAWKSFGDLNNLIPLLQKHCDPKECQTYVKAIARVGLEINTEILDKVFSQYPELEKDLDAKIKKYQKWI